MLVESARKGRISGLASKVVFLPEADVVQVESVSLLVAMSESLHVCLLMDE